MKNDELTQWIADNDRLVIAGLSNGEDGPLSSDEKTIMATLKRCQVRYGEILGFQYFQNLLFTLPDRKPDLFPELQDS